MQIDTKKKEFTLVAPWLARAKPTKLWAKQVVGSHLEHQSTPASPMLTALHPATLEIRGGPFPKPPHGDTSLESRTSHKELLHLGWESRAEEKPPYDKANNDLS